MTRITRITRIILMDDSNREVRDVNIGRRSLGFLGLIGLLLVGLLAWALLTTGALVKRSAQIDALEEELLAARADLEVLGQMEDELVALRGMQKKVLLMLGIEPRDRPEDRMSDLAARATSSPTERPDWNLAGDPLGAPGDALVVPPASVDLSAFAALILTPPPETWPAAGHVTNEFHEGAIARGQRPHLGLDVAGPEGAPILAAGDGVVARIGEDAFLGIFVEIQHGLGYLTVYGHCRSVAVARGEQVRRGQVVAYMGATGRATAPHLHFEIWHNGVVVDPRQYLVGEPPPP